MARRSNLQDQDVFSIQAKRYLRRVVAAAIVMQPLFALTLGSIAAAIIGSDYQSVEALLVVAATVGIYLVLFTTFAYLNLNVRVEIDNRAQLVSVVNLPGFRSTYSFADLEYYSFKLGGFGQAYLLPSAGQGFYPNGRGGRTSLISALSAAVGGPGTATRPLPAALPPPFNSLSFDVVVVGRTGIVDAAKFAMVFGAIRIYRQKLRS